MSTKERTTAGHPPDATALRHELVETLKRAGALTDARVEAAFRAVPRHRFLPDVDLERVYRDEAIPTKIRDGVAISSSSQPAIMAIMLEQLDLRPGDRVLEIGAGTGYNAALLAHLVGETGHVVTVDIDDDIVVAARAHLDEAGFGRVEAVCADGGLGWPADAPYDRIILTVGAPDIAPAWWEQLRAGGRLVLPLGLRGPQVSVAFERRDGHLESVSAKPCGFMALRGAFAGTERSLSLGPEPGLLLSTDARTAADAEALYATLTGPSSDEAVPFPITLREAFDGLRLWLALHEPGFCAVAASGAPAERDVLPWLFRWSTSAGGSFGLVDDRALCLLGRPPEVPAWDGQGEPPAITVYTRSFPPGDPLTRPLLAQVEAWDRAGRPGTASLRLRAYRRDTTADSLPAGIVLDNPWTRLVVDEGTGNREQGTGATDNP